MPRRGVYAVVAGGAVVVAALILAASGPPVPMLARPASTETVTRLPTVTLVTTTPEVSVSSSTTTVPPGSPSVLLVLLVQVVLALSALAFITLLVLIVASLIRRPRFRRHVEPSFEAPEVPDELLATAEERMRLMLTGEPRNAIVAAWLNLETSAAHAGLPRDPAETSTEYTTRVIGTWDVDRARLDDLAALYREARFSAHALAEDKRRRAADDLEALHADLERVARSRDEVSAPGEGSRT